MKLMMLNPEKLSDESLRMIAKDYTMHKLRDEDESEFLERVKEILSVDSEMLIEDLTKRITDGFKL